MKNDELNHSVNDNKINNNKKNCISYVVINIFEFYVLSIVVTLVFLLFLLLSASSRYFINLFI